MHLYMNMPYGHKTIEYQCSDWTALEYECSDWTAMEHEYIYRT